MFKLPLIDEWTAWGDADAGAGWITFRRVPVHWRLMHAWLEHGHPHWSWWYRLWSRVLPYWGDPFCAAYTVVWSPIYESRVEDEHTVEVGWDELPKATRDRIVAQRHVANPADRSSGGVSRRIASTPTG